MMKQIKLIQRLMKNENFRALMSHPKMQELIKDPEFVEILKSKDTDKLKSHPRFTHVMSDPEVAELLKKVNIQDLFK